MVFKYRKLGMDLYYRVIVLIFGIILNFIDKNKYIYIQHIDTTTTMCYYIAVVSNTEYQSYRIARRGYVGEPYGNAQRRAGRLCS